MQFKMQFKNLIFVQKHLHYRFCIEVYHNDQSDSVFDEEEHVCEAIVFPTNNCQLFSIGSFDHLFEYLNDFKDVLRVLGKLAYLAEQKSLCLIDITEDLFYDLTKALVKHRLKSELLHTFKPYTSSNSSPMVLVILDVSSLKEAESTRDLNIHKSRVFNEVYKVSKRTKQS